MKNKNLSNDNILIPDLPDEVLFFQDNANDIPYMCMGSFQVSSLSHKDTTFVKALHQICTDILIDDLGSKFVVAYTCEHTHTQITIIVENYILPNNTHFMYISTPDEPNFSVYCQM